MDQARQGQARGVTILYYTILVPYKRGLWGAREIIESGGKVG
jgi:hypothetical protein